MQYLHSRLFRRTCLTLALVAASAILIPLQSQTVVLQTGPVATSGTHPHRNVVRNAAGVLYCAFIRETSATSRDAVIECSTNGGTTWVPCATVNDPSSGQTGPNLTSDIALAIDSTGVLHVTWASYNFPSYYEQFYRQVVGCVPGPIINISTAIGALTGTDTSGMDIAVDANDTVWMVAHGISGPWVEHLVSIDTAGCFWDHGRLSVANSAQLGRIAIDLQGRVHCTYYSNAAGGLYEHRMYTPGGSCTAGTWNTPFVLGNNTAPQDFFGSLTTDLLGDVHVLYTVDAVPGSTTRLEYRSWSSGTWFPPCLLTQGDLANLGNDRIISLACDETNGIAYAVFRDISTGVNGALCLASLFIGGVCFTVDQGITAPSSLLHRYLAPTIRGRLFPAFDRTSAVVGELHVTWQSRPTQPTPPHSLMFRRVDLGNNGMFIRGDCNGDGQVNIADVIMMLPTPDPASPCPDACDFNDDGLLNIADAIALLSCLFISAPCPAPFPNCGVDPTIDGLTADCHYLCP